MVGHMKQIFLIVVLLLVGCTVSQMNEPDKKPSLSDLLIAELESQSGFFITARADDPQGVDDLAKVTLSVFDLASQALLDTLMQDDGRNGDVNANDGRYYSILTVNQLNGEGSYQIQIQAEDLSGHLSNAILDTIQIVNTVPNDAPTITHTIIPDSLTYENIEQAYFEIQFDDLQGVGTVDSAWCDFYLPRKVVPSYRLILNNSGVDGDEVINDDRFGVLADLKSSIKSSGFYTLRFQLKDQEGALSFPMIRTLSVDLPNLPPVLSNLMAPDSISRRFASGFALSVQVTDPQGLADVERVYFNSTKPNGYASSNNPFALEDDGGEGDDVAGDGVYTEVIRISAEVDTGSYIFEFYAEDIAGLTSQVLKHTMLVTDELVN